MRKMLSATALFVCLLAAIAPAAATVDVVLDSPDFTPLGNYATPLSVSGTSANEVLPAGTAIVVDNVGASDAYCKLGTSSAVAATTAMDRVAAGARRAFSVGPNTYIACITASDTTTVNVSGGVGLDAGGGPGNTGGSVTANAGTNLNTSAIGATGDSAVANPSSSASVIAALKGLMSLTGMGARPLPLQTGTIANGSTSYATAGTAVGSLMTIATGLPGGTVLSSFQFKVKEAYATANTTAINLVVFEANPNGTNSAFTDGSATAVGATDIGKFLVGLAPTSTSVLNTSYGATALTYTGPKVQTDGSGNIYLALTTTAASQAVQSTMVWEFNANY
jgi:hypothetical protein